MSNANKKLFSEIGGLIPHVYYDLICRFTPGAILLTICYFILLSISSISCHIPSISGFSSTHLFLGAVWAYATGLALDCFTSTVTRPARYWFGWNLFAKQYKNVSDVVTLLNIDVSNLNRVSLRERLAILDGIRDYIAVCLPDRARVLAKMKAEVAMLRNLAMVVLFVAVLSLIKKDITLMGKELVKSHILAVLGVVEIILAFGIIGFEKALIIRMANLYSIAKKYGIADSAT